MSSAYRTSLGKLTVVERQVIDGVDFSPKNAVKRGGVTLFELRWGFDSNTA
jgi:hypothetical protein